ncbi:cytochrome b-c1 complex subunit 2, mitochondrial-like [Maniola jurtina]|uniref:cytochrome b-c1 complex subunit 2, mitochondrial-like n=1 Tax=Maniola jurtina TaxID=191418 RepID=UPI001E689DB7|nr:cytochrome b-c1 complex subunit 2, mitochondrial-like [Maniola jurtina]
MKKLSPKILQHYKTISTSRPGRAECYPQAVYGPTEIQKSVMLNGIQIVAARVSGALMTACTVMFQAGSRFETNDDLGASHFIRTMSSASGREYTAFGKLRVLQQQGAYLTCTSDRQTIAFNLRCPLPLFNTLKGYLADTAARCSYHEWEIADRKQQVRGDLTRMHPEQRVLDLVQRACWAGPLANSMFCEEERIDSMTSEKLTSYAATNFKSIHCAVASVGIPFEETIELAEMIDSRVGRPTSEQCHSCPRFRSGIETYDLGSDSDTWIAAAVRGCGTGDVNNLFKHALVASACGTGSMTQGQHWMDRTSEGPIGILSLGDIFSDYRALNISYAETGVFGIVAKCKAEMACNAAYAATDFLANVYKLSPEQIENGKKRLQVSLCFHDEDPVKASQGLALQALSGAHIDTAEQAVSMLDAINAADVTDTAATLASRCNQMAIAIVGDVGAVPTDIFYNM